MFWMKKLTAAGVLAALVAGGLIAGLALRPGNIALATMPLPTDPQVKPETPEDPDAATKRLDKRLADLQKQKELLDATLADLQAEKAKFDEAKRAKEAADAAAELGRDIAVVVENGTPTEYRIYEVVNGKIAEMTCSDLDLLTVYLTRAHNDPKGPRKLRVAADKGQAYENLRPVFTACAAAGYKTASFGHDRPAGYFHRQAPLYHADLSLYYHALGTRLEGSKPKPGEVPLSPGEIDLRKYAPKQP